MRRPSWKKLLLLGGGAGLLGVVALGGVGYALTEVPEPSDRALQQATKILWSDRSELARIGETNRVPVPLDQVSQSAQLAVLAAEDRGFYSEPGISPRGIGRALFANVRGGGVEQGGSTITQQYAKNAFLTTERTFTRKVKEVFIALKMTRTRSKDQILEDYLNTIYFGRGAYGIQAATESYFAAAPQGKAGGLSVAQAAVLAASIRSPAAYDPSRNPERARERWDYVLDGMVAQGWLSAQERAGLRYPEVRDVEDVERERSDRSGPKGYVLAQVERELEQRFDADRIEQGGLLVTTTLRRDAQAAAERAVQAEVPAPDLTPDPDCTEGARVCRDRAAANAIQGALVAVKPGTGEVFAYYGGRTGNGGTDWAGRANPQDAGSTMKPYVLAAALDSGMSLRSRFNGNSPKEFEGYPRPVRNFGDDDYGRIDLVRATANSVNTVYVALAEEVGPQQVREAAYRAGVGRDVRLAEPDGNPALGIALGVYGIPVIDQAVGFATFAARGVQAEPFMVRAVEETDGTRIYDRAAKVTRGFSPEVAADATYAMQQVVEDGSAARNGQLEDDRPAAGKTGTTQESNDAWMVGFTPQLSTAVWIGRGNNDPIVGELGSPRGLTGGSAPTRIWKAFMDAAHEGLPVEQFPERADVGERFRAADAQVEEQPRERRRRRQAPEVVQETTAPEPSPEVEQTQAPAETEAPVAPEPAAPTRRATVRPPAPTAEPDGADQPADAPAQPAEEPADPPAPSPRASG